jgi:uncharacterized membrane protein
MPDKTPAQTPAGSPVAKPVTMPATMPVTKPVTMSDQRLENIIGRLLRAGVLLSAAVVALGGIFYLVFEHAARVDYRTFVAAGPDTRTVSGITHSALHLSSEGLMQAGLVLLILTPIARVMLAVVGFALERDRLYAVISFIVLAILAFSLIYAI